MNRVIAVALLFLLACVEASACDTLKNAASEIEERFKDNPHSTMHDCVRPFLVDSEAYEAATSDERQHFLDAIVLLTSRIVEQHRHRVDYLDYLQTAATRYLGLCERSDRIPRAGCQRALAAWGRVTLLKNDWSDLLGRFGRHASRGTAFFNNDGVARWDGILRCSGNEYCRHIDCALRNDCAGDRAQLAAWFAVSPGREHCRAFVDFLTRAIAEGRLDVTQPKKNDYEVLCPAR